MPGNADLLKATRRKKNGEGDKPKAAVAHEPFKDDGAIEDEPFVEEVDTAQDESVQESSVAAKRCEPFVEESFIKEPFIEEVEPTPSVPIEENDDGKQEFIRKIIGLKESLIEEVRALYNASLAKSGFGGGVDAVADDLAVYLARSVGRLKTDGERDEISGELFAKFMATAFSECKDFYNSGAPIKLPLAAKITVALDIHSGGKRTARLCDTIYEIFKEAASLICGDELRAKELIGDLLSFVVGQGIKT